MFRLCLDHRPKTTKMKRRQATLTLLILERRDDLVDDRLGKVGLFTLLHLLFIAHPAVKDGLELCSKGDLLLLDVVL